MFKSVQKSHIQAMPKKCQTKITMDVIIIFSLHENNVHGMYKKRVFFYASGASYINFLIKKTQNRLIGILKLVKIFGAEIQFFGQFLLCILFLALKSTFLPLNIQNRK